MIQHTKILTIILLFLVKISVGQDNIFDCDNSKRFAEYLFNTGQFELSQHELERISFFCEYDSTSQLTLLKSYRKMSKFDKANQFFASKNIDSLNNLNPDFRDEYIRLLMTERKYSDVQKEIADGLNFSQEEEHKIGTELLLKNWEKAYQLSIQDNTQLNFKLAGLRGVAEKSHKAKRKSPVLAAIMSAVIPGTGKMYCGYWGDGAMSFMFTASSAFFSVRGFNKYGSKSIYPWIIGGLAASYYTANIYGGASSANRYNENLDHAFIHETEQILYSDY
jgi:hypothetical protein